MTRFEKCDSGGTTWRHSAVTLLLVGMIVLVGRVRAAGTISGMVFRDFNMDGIRQTAPVTAIEVGVAGVTVTAVDEAGTTVTTTTAADGSYTLPALPGNSARVEVTGLPPGFSPSVVGSNSASLVMFADISAGNVAGMDAALYHEGDYCGNPRIVTSCFVPRFPVIGTPYDANQSAVVYYPYNTDARNGFFTETMLATDAQVGTTFGLAYQTSSQTMFVASYVRRGSGQGSADSTGAIYSLPLAGVPAVFMDLNGFAGINTGVNPHSNTNPPNTTFWLRDTAAYSQVGKIGLGDMEISEDDRTLYVMNLFQRELITLPIGETPAPPAPGSVGRFPIPIPASCNGDGVTAPASTDVRPFALKYHDGLVYVGMVCTAESMVQALNPTTFAEVDVIRPFLRAYVYTFNPATGAYSTAPILEFPLNYPRLQLNDGFPSTLNDGEWLPWNDTWAPAQPGFPAGTYMPVRTVPSLILSNPQPLLTAIEFDNQGFMMLGFRDRFADQAYSDGDPGPVVSSTNVNARQGGDILLACLDAGGNWTLEANRICGTRTGNSPAIDSGPGGNEFYYDERFGVHRETALGGLGILPGRGELVSTNFDTWDLFESGTITFDNATGGRVRRAQVVPPGSLFRKGGGLGDVEFICDAPPIQIGNRVWLDIDHDGVQDADEAPIAGVTVQLFSPGGALLATAVTDAHGNYYFSSGPGVSTGSARYGVAGLNPNTADYEVRIPLNQPALTGLVLTLPRNDATVNGGSRDSDGTEADRNGNPNAIASVTTGRAGMNNHTYDFGFFPPTLTITKDDGVTTMVIGSTTTYVITINNTTTAPFNTVTFLDDIPVNDPDGFDPATVSWTCTSNPAGLCPNASGTNSNINETIATIPPAGQVIYRITATLRPSFSGTQIENTARLSTGANATDRNTVTAALPTVTPTPGGTSPPGSTPTPGNFMTATAIAVLMTQTAVSQPSQPPGMNPTLGIQPDVPFGIPGSPVDWTITIINPNAMTIPGVILTVTFPPELEILGVDVPPGVTFTIVGQTVYINIGDLPPGRYPEIIIYTRVRGTLPLPISLTVTASLNVCPCESSSSIVTVTRLPDTGEPRRIPPMTGVGITLLITAVAELVIWQCRPRRKRT